MRVVLDTCILKLATFPGENNASALIFELTRTGLVWLSPGPVRPSLRNTRTCWVIGRTSSLKLPKAAASATRALVDRQMLSLRHRGHGLGGKAPQTPLKGSNDSKGQRIDHEPPRTARTLK